MNWKYVDQNRIADHICYISNSAKFQVPLPNWRITVLRRNLRQIIAASPPEQENPRQMIVGCNSSVGRWERTTLQSFRFDQLCSRAVSGNRFILALA